MLRRLKGPALPVRATLLCFFAWRWRFFTVAVAGPRDRWGSGCSSLQRPLPEPSRALSSEIGVSSNSDTQHWPNCAPTGRLGSVLRDPSLKLRILDIPDTVLVPQGQGRGGKVGCFLHCYRRDSSKIPFHSPSHLDNNLISREQFFILNPLC